MDELRLTAAYFVKESNLTKGAKLQIMNFLEFEASDAQVMALILDGKIQYLDEMAEDIVYDRWDAEMISEKGELVKKVIKRSRQYARYSKTPGKKSKSNVVRKTLRNVKRKAKIFASDPLYKKRADKDLKRAARSAAKFNFGGKTPKKYAKAMVDKERAVKSGGKYARRAAGAFVAGYAGAVGGTSHALCKAAAKGNKAKYDKCMWGAKKKAKPKKKK